MNLSKLKESRLRKKFEKKGRTKEELNQVIEWLTGFNETKLQELINEKATFEIFFIQAICLCFGDTL